MSARRPRWIELASAMGAGAVRLLGATWRIRRTNTAAVDAWLAAGGRCIYTIWHSQILATMYDYRDLSVGGLVSQSRDGELVARVIERLGFATARGSSTRGGQEGFQEMVRLAREGHSLVITPDGPRGPRERVKPGVVRLASVTGLQVLPVSCVSRGEWRADSWDGFRVPRPFARVLVAYGDLIEVPGGLDAAAAESWRVRIEDVLREGTRRLEQEAGGGA
jgi:lysophospholipid acyltransferase (LPLAT)-like uncharacterized protein